MRPPSKLFLFTFLIMFFISCSSNSEKENIVLNEMTKSLEASNISVHKSSESFLHSLEDKLTDPVTSEKAKVWEPKAKEVSKLSNKIYDYIKKLKSDLMKMSAKNNEDWEKSFDPDNKEAVNRIFFRDKRGDELMMKLRNHKEDLFSIDSDIRMAFKDSYYFPIDQPVSYFFKGSTVSESLAFLTQFQNTIKINENRIIAFCSNHIGYVDGPSFYDSYSVIIGQNSNILKPGDSFVITAGVGAFSKVAMPEITIAGTKIPVNESGQAIYELESVSGLGKHSFPVTIVYTDQNGKKQNIKQTIEYIVKNCKN